MPIAYKLTDQKMRTYNGFQWKLNKPVETPGAGNLCSCGWLHFYEHPLLAVLHNPIHADIENPRLFEAKVSGKCLKDRQLKIGYTKATLIKELPLPVVALNQRIAYGILCAKITCKDKTFIKWANNWLSGKDRTVDAAHAAAHAAYAAHAADAAYAAAHAAYAAADAAAYAADAAAYAADAAHAAYAAAYAAHAAEDAAAPAAAHAAHATNVELNLLKLAKKALRY